MILTGPRRAGKTVLLRNLFPRAEYYLLEDPDLIARVRTDPRSFMEEVRPPAILDEIQNVPEILNYVRSRIDRAPEGKGRWFLAGSQEPPLMKGVTESMVGVAKIAVGLVGELADLVGFGRGHGVAGIAAAQPRLLSRELCRRPGELGVVGHSRPVG